VVQASSRSIFRVGSGLRNLLSAGHVFLPQRKPGDYRRVKCMTDEVREGIIIEKVGNGPPFRRSALENAS
jgi:hypothetical protein